MNSRIILHGGNANVKSDGNDKFFRDIIVGTGKQDMVRVLCVYFARPEGRWEDSYAEDQSTFRAMGIELGLEVETKLATYDMEELLEDIVVSDVVYINGGYKGHLKDTLFAIGVENFRQMMEGKTLVGISAGANVLGKYYYSQAIDDIREGVGLLDIKILTHYRQQEHSHLSKLKEHKDDLPLVAIPEEKYVVIE